MYCADHIYTMTFWGEFFLRNNPRIVDFFDEIYFKTVKIIFFLPQNPVLKRLFRKKNRFYLRLRRIVMTGKTYIFCDIIRIVLKPICFKYTKSDC